MVQPIPRLRPTWTFRRAPRDDELLSSWLVANARRHGGQLHTFCEISFGKTEIWTRDIDRHAGPRLLAKASELGGLSLDQIKALTLRDQVSRVQTSTSAQSNPPWLLRLGVYHRARTNCGVQFCAECLRESGAFKRSWRWAFAITCDVEEHEGMSLQDCCPHCKAEVVPHRSPRCDFARCHQCGHSLTSIQAWSECSSAETLQWLLQAILRDSPDDRLRLAGSLWSAVVPTTISESRALFRGLRDLLTCLRHANVRPALTKMGYVLPASSQPLESLGRRDRVAWLSVLADATIDGERGLVAFLRRLDLTQRPFASGDFPAWIMRAIATLPIGTSLPYRSRKAPLIAELRRLALVHPRDSLAYREQRAALVLSSIAHQTA